MILSSRSRSITSNLPRLNRSSASSGEKLSPYAFSEPGESKFRTAMGIGSPSTGGRPEGCVAGAGGFVEDDVPVEAPDDDEAAWEAGVAGAETEASS